MWNLLIGHRRGKFFSFFFFSDCLQWKKKKLFIDHWVSKFIAEQNDEIFQLGLGKKHNEICQSDMKNNAKFGNWSWWKNCEVYQSIVGEKNSKFNLRKIPWNLSISCVGKKKIGKLAQQLHGGEKKLSLSLKLLVQIQKIAVLPTIGGRGGHRIHWSVVEVLWSCRFVAWF